MRTSKNLSPQKFVKNIIKNFVVVSLLFSYKHKILQQLS